MNTLVLATAVTTETLAGWLAEAPVPAGRIEVIERETEIPGRLDRVEGSLLVIEAGDTPVNWELLAQVKQVSPETGLLVLTHRRDFVLACRCLEVMADGLLLLPASREEFLAALRELNQRRVHRSQREKVLRQELDRLKPFVKTQLLYNLIYGNLKHMKEIWEIHRLSGLEQLPNCAMVMNIDNFAAITANRSPRLKHELRQKVLEALQEATNLLTSGIAATVGEDSFAVLCHLEYEEDRQVVEESVRVARLVKQVVEERTSTSVSVGIGRYYGDIRNINVSFLEAMGALRHKFFTGASKVIHIHEVEPFSQDAALFSPEAEAQLTARVRLGDEKGALEVLGEIMESTLTRGLRPEMIKGRTLELVVLLLRAAMEGGVDSEHLLSKSSTYLEKLMSIELASELQEFMLKVVGELTREVVSGQHYGHQKLVHRAVRFIKEHYTEPITLEDVAGSIGLSACYFSHIFKKEMGCPFIEYLTRIRIDEAQMLLRNTNLNVAETARRVGYHDPNYFSRVFKNMVGVPPSRFR
ncbi:hypothetical protein SY88_01585 [Clostridiales bacterium PH28_bin88]|nr:hypothetical protein SY88_01585 [Clostridiales bacterium PH28_bin88]